MATTTKELGSAGFFYFALEDSRTRLQMEVRSPTSFDPSALASYLFLPIIIYSIVYSIPFILTMAMYFVLNGNNGHYIYIYLGCRPCVLGATAL